LLSSIWPELQLLDAVIRFGVGVGALGTERCCIAAPFIAYIVSCVVPEHCGAAERKCPSRLGALVGKHDREETLEPEPASSIGGIKK
jgi:hypothetical protein